MIDVKTADRELQTYIRPQTFPVAIRMLRPDEPIPDRARRPARDFKKLSMNCQVIDMARRYGWTLVLTREDSICSLGIAALGFEKPTHLHNSGTLCEGMYTETKAAGQRSEAAVDKFAPGEFATLLVAPLDRTTFEPHLVCIYANPAQVMRLTQAALWKRGGKLTSSFGGRIDCSEIIVTTMRTDQPQVILPCSGDRIFGQTQDHEMAFTIPWGQMEEMIEGLKGTHDGGIRYPITQFMEYEAKLPPKYLEANRIWEVEQGRSQFTNRDRVVAAYRRSFADRAPGDTGSVQDGASPGLPRAMRGAREGEAADRHRRGRGGSVDDRDAPAESRDDAPGHVRGSAVHPRPDARHDRLLQAVGRRDRQDGHRPLVLGADRVDQPHLTRQLPGLRRAVPQGARRLLQGQEGRRDHAHLRDHLPDLRGPDPVRLLDRFVRPRPAGRPEALRESAQAIHGRGQWPSGGDRQRRRHQVREDVQRGDGRGRAALH